MKIFFLYFLILLNFFQKSEAYSNEVYSDKFKPPIVADVNLYKIDINSNFNGLEFLIFIAKNNQNDFFGKIIGPPRKYLVAKKEKFMGLWLKKKIIFFNCVPSYYSFWNIDEKPNMSSEILDFYQIGFNSLDLCIDNYHKLRDEEIVDFKEKLFSHMKKKKLFNGPSTSFKTNNNLIKISSFIPDNASVGHYLVNLFSFSNETLKIDGEVKISFFVRHLKLNKFLSNLNNYYPKMYTLFLLMIAFLNVFVVRFILKRNK